MTKTFEDFVSVERKTSPLYKHELFYKQITDIRNLPGYNAFIDKLNKIHSSASDEDLVPSLYNHYNYTQDEVREVTEACNNHLNDDTFKIRIIDSLRTALKNLNIGPLDVVVNHIDAFVLGYRTYRQSF